MYSYLQSTLYAKVALALLTAGAHPRNAAAARDPAASVFMLTDRQVGHRFASLRRAILAGAAATLLLVGASLLVSLLEQVRDRRRLLAVLAAFGTRRATIGRSMLW